MNIILFLLVISFIVFFHELGHFIVAKLNHISVMEFSIGMGPCIFKFHKKETQYSLRLLPIGGYCLMVGEDEETDDENALNNKPKWLRALVLLAGPGFNFLLAFILSVILIHNTGCDPATLNNIAENSAAEEAGIKPGDSIVEIDGKNIYNYRELLLYMELAEDGAPVDLTMKSGETGEEYKVKVTPRINEAGEYKLGVQGGYIPSSGFGNDLKYGALELRYWVKSTITSLKLIITGQVSGDQIMGPVGIGNQVDQVIDEAVEISSGAKETVINVILNLMNWAILISVNLGVMNLLPIPALDGGRLFFILVEAVRRKKIPQEKEAAVNVIGFIVLIGIMVVVFFNDIKNVFF